MSFGPALGVYAHASGVGGLNPRRDRDLEQLRLAVPRVPRAPRTKPRPSSFGAAARAIFERQTSELQRPCDENPFPYARKNFLQRERDNVDNQGFQFGPKMICAEIKEDFSRNHTLGREMERNKGTGLGDLTDDTLNVRLRNPARTHTLLHERNAADQTLDFYAVTTALAEKTAQKRDHGRRNTLSRELREVTAKSECTSTDADDATSYARRSVLKREVVENESLATPRGASEGYGKKDILIGELGLPQSWAVASRKR